MYYNNVFFYVPDYNYALHQSASQKSTSISQSADKAVDGDLTTESLTYYHNSGGDEWWKVDLGKRILLREVVVYVKTGNCICNFFVYSGKFYLAAFHGSF